MTTPTAEKLHDDAVAFFRRARVPASMRWVESLSALNYRLFVVELADALKTAALTGRTEELQRLLEGWEATAEVDGSPELQAELKRSKKYRPL